VTYLIENVRILQVWIIQNLLDPRGPRSVEVHADGINQQPKRGSPSGTARQDRPQEGVLDPDQRHPAPGGDPLTAPGGRACAPDEDAIRRPGKARVQLMPGKFEHPPQPMVAQEREVLVEKPPGHPAQSKGALRHWVGQLSGFAVLAIFDAAAVEPVIAPSVFCHCTKGASVT
jgi:hypothetical protein